MKWQTYPAYKDSGIESLGEIPTDWNAMPLKYACRESALYGANIPASEYIDEGVRFIRTTDVDDLGRLNASNAVYLDPSLAAEYMLEDGELLLSRSGTIGRSFVYDKEKHGDCAYAGYLVGFKPKSMLLSRFAFYFTKAKHFEEWLSLSVISSTIGNVNGQKYANMPLPIPLLVEQRAIVAFLDRKTAHIDALIAKKERQIELLQEKRAALISHAVTKGLDPTVPMKDSGIKWLGEIPAHWEIAQLRRVVTKFVDYRGRTPEKVESGVPLITARNIKNGHIDFSLSTEYMREDEYEDWMVRGRPEIGDVLVTTEAPLGETAQITDTRIALAQRIILLKVNTLRMINGYLKYHFLSAFGQGELWSRATGSTAVGIRADRFKDSLVTVPPLEEQAKIVHLLNNKIAILERPLRKIEQSVERLHEYRAALISAAVTGKIDVRDEQMQCD
jgi:type I restriction enzyme S subunit